MSQNISKTEIDKEAQLLLLKGERKLRCKTFTEPINNSMGNIDRKISGSGNGYSSFNRSKGPLDDKQIISVVNIVSGPDSNQRLITQLWYYE